MLLGCRPLDLPTLKMQFSGPDLLLVAIAALGCLLAGCGTTQSQQATEQLLMSDALDRAVGAIDFRELSGEKVYLDTRYLKDLKVTGVVNADYLISSLRQQMMAADCRLQDEATQADYIVEARAGALGTDGHSLMVGIPSSKSLGSASTIMANAPLIPLLPEISFVRREDKLGATKVAVFAYHRETKAPVWQSGISRARSTAKDTWVFGAGPFQRGTIREGTQFAGAKFRVPLAVKPSGTNRPKDTISLDQEARFLGSHERKKSPVQAAVHLEPVEDKPQSPAPTTAPAAAAPTPTPETPAPPAAEVPPVPKSKP